jgi:malonate transporter
MFNGYGRGDRGRVAGVAACGDEAAGDALMHLGATMSPILDLLLLFVPFFALVLMGWAAARVGLLPLEGIPALNSFVLYFGLSAMVFRLSASGALMQEGGLLGLLLAYGAGGAVIAGLALAWSLRAGHSRRDGGLLALVTAFPNTGFLGLPLAHRLAGPAGRRARGRHAHHRCVDSEFAVSGLGAFAWA